MQDNFNVIIYVHTAIFISGHMKSVLKISHWVFSNLLQIHWSTVEWQSITMIRTPILLNRNEQFIRKWEWLCYHWYYSILLTAATIVIRGVLILLIILTGYCYTGIMCSFIITKFDDQNTIENDASSSENCPTYPNFCTIKTETPEKRLYFEECHNMGFNWYLWDIFRCCCCYNR